MSCPKPLESLIEVMRPELDRTSVAPDGRLEGLLNPGGLLESLQVSLGMGWEVVPGLIITELGYFKFSPDPQIFKLSDEVSAKFSG